jgi:hypothetical protein
VATGEGDGPGKEINTPFLKWNGVFYFPKKREIAVNFLPDSYFLLKIKQIKTIG